MLKAISALVLESIILLVLLQDDGLSVWVLVTMMVLVVVMTVLLVMDRVQGYVLLAGTLLLLALGFGALEVEMGVLQLWSMIGVGIPSIMLGVVVARRSIMLRGVMGMDREQERLFRSEVMRSILSSLIAMVVVMVISLGALSLIALADQGIGSGGLMALLAVMAMVSLGALVTLRDRI